ncbi:MAG: RNA polymerase sigma factor [Muribaculaceae bacterium]|nr:RNA polymerase sigma factor [Muribaculaceae bacterium]
MNPRKTSDIDIFKNIVSQYQDRLFRFAYIRIGIREVAEDIVQDVFIRFYRTMIDGKEIKSHEAYLLRSISNSCIDWQRKKKETMISIDDAEDIPEEFEEDIIDEFRRIARLLDGLPENQAEAVRLRCYDNLPFQEIADLQGISESTAKSRYRHAIWYIKEKLNLNKKQK